jgi:phenylpropionate dioxygenase-like ring-hydroxylating dioxygenase large terminal subunit
MMPHTSLDSEWLPVCNSAEIDQACAQGFVIAGEFVFAWRNAAGRIHVWRDYCPHRGARLSLGTVRDAELECPYHGWRYDANGQCVHIPAHPSQTPPARACTTRFRSEEKYGVVWMCFGEPARPLDFFPQYHLTGARCINLAPQTIHSSGPRVVENFLDLAHFPFVHPGILGEPTHTEVADYEVDEGELGLEARGCVFWQPNGIPGQSGADMEYEYRVKRALIATLSKKAQGDMGALHIMIVVSPVSPTQSRAWLVSAHEDETIHTDEQLYDFNMDILVQDTPVVESQQPKYLPLDPTAELHQRCDRMSVAYRRWLAAQGFAYGTSLGVSDE